jgi:hypothetical protein
VRAPLPAPVAAVTDHFLALADERLPGRLQGLYLHGSLGFGEWYDGRSDIDYVAVLDGPPDPATVEALREVHGRVAETFPRPPFDGFHLTWADLARPAYDCPDVPCTQAGSFYDQARLDVHPVTWHELAHHGVTVRGPVPDDLTIWTDEQALRDYTRENLDSYWAPEVEQLRRFPEEAGRPDITTWFVLGTSRLHHLLATGALTSKSGAGRYAVSTFGERWRPLVTDALAVRATGEESGDHRGDPRRRGRDTIDFAEMVVSSGLALGR